MRTDCATPELPVVGCPAAVVPGATPTPTPSPSPSQVATPPPSSVQHQGEAVGPPAPGPVLTAAPAPVLAAAPPAALVDPGAPSVALPAPAVVPAIVPAATTASQVATPAVAGVPLTTAVSSAYGIVVFGVLGVALLVSFLSGLRPATSTPAPPPGGTVRTQRTRLWAGLAVLAAAAVVGAIGWYRVSGEPMLNRQLPFLASAGIAVVVLAVLGGALVVAEQLRADQHRLGELESAVRALTDALSPLVEQPARRTDSDVLVQ